MGGEEQGLDELTFSVDLDFDGVFDAEATGAAPELTLEDVGIFTMVVQVRNPHGATDAKLVTLTVSELPLVPEDVPRGCGCSAQGEPQTGALIGLGLALLGGWRRRDGPESRAFTRVGDLSSFR